MDNRKAVMHNAYVWDCMECGTENFQRAVVFSPEASDAMGLVPPTEDGEEWRGDEHRPEVQIEGHWMTYPRTVTCGDCGKTFDCEDPGEKPND